ncbi:carboxypeptidase-like regulatory domain-containing protein [Emticicia sp. 21SJ11W-3]|uniref:carboxypeptidase-like regulatory domain-containing protein n=1 Tax=Emticicia sp. 21SJ11W-3 TaxID=2916755 RepID=UPI0020A1FDB7|nr:carboxypeptidase-like regulatory domain-containing protein [Emticicia sp. 21SJ11W-3]UTA69066.1 carboxypeptidase-like regulatory domain-containing protein [Emticicia sp. 21SJ11W-3]
MAIKSIFFSLLLLFIVSEAACQIMITGRVVAKYDNSPLPGVSIVQKGTGNLTMSGQDGAFSLNVSDTNDTLMFSSIGYITKEYRLKGVNQILVKMKDDCHIDIFDAQQIDFYAKSGVLHNPIGGQFNLSFPVIYNLATLHSSASFQSDFQHNKFLNIKTELKNFISECDFDMTALWHYWTFNYQNNFHTKVNSFETQLHFSKKILPLDNTGLIVGFGHLASVTDNQSFTAPVIGLRISPSRFFYSSIELKAALFKNNTELQGQIMKNFKSFSTFIQFYRLKSFSELSIGIGKEFDYRLKKQRLKK